MKGDRVEYLLRLEALPDELPPHQRMRSALKRLLRDHRFRCREIRNLTSEAAAQAPDAPPTDPGANVYQDSV